jgi:hypothetical protein
VNTKLKAVRHEEAAAKFSITNRRTILNNIYVFIFRLPGNRFSVENNILMYFETVILFCIVPFNTIMQNKLTKLTFTILTFQNLLFTTVRSAHTTFVFCICLRTNSDLCHLHKKPIVFITEMKSVYSAVRTGSLNEAVCAPSFKG